MKFNKSKCCTWVEAIPDTNIDCKKSLAVKDLNVLRYRKLDVSPQYTLESQKTEQILAYIKRGEASR